jgi:hypothetical protein
MFIEVASTGWGSAVSGSSIRSRLNRKQHGASERGSKRGMALLDRLRHIFAKLVEGEGGMIWNEAAEAYGR